MKFRGGDSDLIEGEEVEGEGGERLVNFRWRRGEINKYQRWRIVRWILVQCRVTLELFEK